MSTDTLEDTFWRRVRKSTGCWEWTGATKGSGAQQYGRVWYRGRVVGKAHRLAWEIVNGPVPDGLAVLHRCDYPRCVRAEPGGNGHLFLGTDVDNASDMIAKRRAIWQRTDEAAARWRSAARRAPRLIGEENPQAKLSETMVYEAVVLRGRGVHYRDLAEHFGVDIASIWRAVNGKTWRHLAVPGSATANDGALG